LDAAACPNADRGRERSLFGWNVLGFFVKISENSGLQAVEIVKISENSGLQAVEIVKIP